MKDQSRGSRARALDDGGNVYHDALESEMDETFEHPEWGNHPIENAGMPS
ncbi:MAG: hypothetical protein GWQ05_09550 [Verrucomicrobiaceae bacterium]|nr:hypothetical protein [Verrucomicrobiaceae bacterium]NCF91187.1 hypothetical protein [Verrucomicrobiaceae bacterium]